ncbi:MAG: hypothetical protein DMF64_10845 [Acidobacteria bacterium]|nr:MAG: hypothetical protein DMF64_10845 [Acidobacteriota bacterium]
MWAILLKLLGKRSKMRRLSWQQWLVALAFLLALSVTALFGLRTVRRAIYWHSHRDEPIRPWMSVPYVAHSYRVPPHLLYKAIGLTPVPHDRRPLRLIAREQNRPVEQLIVELQEAIVHARQSFPPPPSAAPPPHGGTPP